MAVIEGTQNWRRMKSEIRFLREFSSDWKTLALVLNAVVHCTLTCSFVLFKKKTIKEMLVEMLNFWALLICVIVSDGNAALSLMSVIV